ncbi:MAG TPA: hypothetical protein VGD78_10155 [Chthoniobacterales bacterium]
MVFRSWGAEDPRNEFVLPLQSRLRLFFLALFGSLFEFLATFDKLLLPHRKRLLRRALVTHPPMMAPVNSPTSIAPAIQSQCFGVGNNERHSAITQLRT